MQRSRIQFTSRPRHQVLLIDDEGLLRDGLCAMISLEEDYSVIGAIVGGPAIGTVSLSVEPDVVIIDFGVLGIRDADTVRAIRQRWPNMPVLALTFTKEDEVIEAALRAVALSAPRVPFVSNVTGTWITDEEAGDPGYWVRHLRETVRFAAGLEVLLLIDRISRRFFLISTFLVGGALLTGLAFLAGLSPALAVVLFTAFAFVLAAAVNLEFVYPPELFPTDLRASGVGIAVAASRIGSRAKTTS